MNLQMKQLAFALLCISMVLFLSALLLIIGVDSLLQLGVKLRHARSITLSGA